MANQRSSNSRLLAIGFAVLVVGVLLVLVIVRNTDDPPADTSPVAAQGAEDDVPAESATPLTPEQLSTARLPLPLEVPEGTEAMAMRLNFVRAVAAIPAPGDQVNVYRFLAAADDASADGDEPSTEPPSVPSRLPEPGPESEQVLASVEVLAVTGPLPAANDGVLTVVLAVPSPAVPGLMPLADDAQLWFTLVSSPDDEPTEAATERSTEEPT